jgi:hypothetical protein
MLQQLPLHHAFVSDSLLSPSDMIHSLLSREMMSRSTTLIGTVLNPPLIDYQKVDSSNSPSMPTTGPQCCTNEQLKTTVLTDAVSHVDAWKRTSIMYSDVPATVKAILMTKPNTSSWTSHQVSYPSTYGKNDYASPRSMVLQPPTEPSTTSTHWPWHTQPAPASTYKQSLCPPKQHWMGTLSMRLTFAPLEVMHIWVL